ncbi:MAG: ABC transporter [Bacteroidetes bacterium SW_11_45_7]|nr:MAG: ABC transporter [Bacteroidetes bacterium SW_11_45_7]
MEHLRYLNKFFRKYKWRLLTGILFVAIANTFRVLPPRVIRYSFDLVKENIAYYRLFEGFALQEKFYIIFSQGLMFFGITVLALAALQGLFMFFMRQTLIVMSRIIEYDLKNEIYDKYQQLDLAFYKRNNTGDLMSRITEDVGRVRMYLGPALMYTIDLIVLSVIIVTTMLTVNVRLTLIILLPLPILSVSIYYIRSLINKKSEAIQQQLSKLTTSAQEIYSGIRVIKTYVQESQVYRYFAHQSNLYRTLSLDLARVEAFFFPFMLLLIGFSTIFTIYFGGIEVIRGNITTGNIAEFVIYINMLTWPVTAIGVVVTMVQRAAASQKRINEFLNTQPSIVSHAGKNGIQIKGDIEFRNVSFVYPDTGVEALKNVSFTLKAGQRLAIVGRTGSGKSTMAELLVRLYDPTGGQILMDGKEIRHLPLSTLRQQVGYVPQDVFLFSDSVTNNIAFGKHNQEDGANVSEEEVERAARYASIDKEIRELNGAFQAAVGERGVTLSGGQKQRISLARTFLQNPQLFVLDDCLSAVDANTEERILNNLEAILCNKTAIIITHRVFTMMHFDKILFMEDGYIIEEGTHEELQRKNGAYANLLQMQKADERSAE